MPTAATDATDPMLAFAGTRLPAGVPGSASGAARVTVPATSPVGQPCRLSLFRSPPHHPFGLPISGKIIWRSPLRPFRRKRSSTRPNGRAKTGS